MVLPMISVKRLMMGYMLDVTACVVVVVVVDCEPIASCVLRVLEVFV